MAKQTGISRRMFMGLTVAGAGAVAAGAAGCTPTATEPGAGSGTGAGTEGTASANCEQDSIWQLDPIGEPTETRSADVVVVGAGGTGLAAAIQAKQLGLDVLVLEKMGATGGSFICTEGMFAVESHWQEERGVTTTVDEAVIRVMDYHHWIPDIDLYRTYFSQSAETIKWCEDLGADFTDLLVIGDSIVCWHVYHAEPGESPGTGFARNMTKAAENLAIEIKLETNVKKVLMEDGKVAGVLAESGDGTVLKVEAPVVILGAGGYGQNETLVHELSKIKGDPMELGTPGRTGDGLKMGLDAGGVLCDFPGTMPYAGPCVKGATWTSLAYSVSLQPKLWINQDCQRFVNEDMFSYNFAYAGLAVKNHEKVFVILTQDDLDRYETVGPDITVFTFCVQGTPMTGLKDQLSDIQNANGSILVADTPEDLAAQTGLDPVALAETINRYNGYCASGHDPEFSKPAEFLTPLNGPFYALECGDASFSTVGGLKVNSSAQVLKADGEPVPGLYAGGCDAGGLYADSYDVGITNGSQAGWAINSGRLAAKHAATYIG
ncbi:MAG: FAD-dependent oxidoreductase [Bifidobacteriaceae bacterium]|jgi:fumarate reductase flavoprotein subunit|nr:FAD-dependent oxidoreductase [Bifidobacteriaceae bacterium]